MTPLMLDTTIGRPDSWYDAPPEGIPEGETDDEREKREEADERAATRRHKLLKCFGR